MGSDYKELLGTLDEDTIGFSLDSIAIENLTSYCELLELWGKKTDLIAPCSAQELVERHIRDSLRALHICLSEMKYYPKSLADIGSGAGLPGLVWSICLPDCQVSLVEPREKRVIFLSEAKRRLQLSRVTVVRERFENFIPEASLALVVCRALGSRERFLLRSAEVLEGQGVAVELLGSSAIVEEERLREESRNSGFQKFALRPYEQSFSGEGKTIAFSWVGD